MTNGQTLEDGILLDGVDYFSGETCYGRRNRDLWRFGHNGRLVALAKNGARRHPEAVGLILKKELLAAVVA